MTAYPQGHSSNGRGKEQNNGDTEEQKVQIGFRVNQATLNLVGRDRTLVGLGSFIVNVQAECNGCHSAGPQTEFAAGGSPYLFNPPSTVVHQTEAVNPATFLGGGRDFGVYPGGPVSVNIYSRNLTPNNTGRPVGGLSYPEFALTMQTGRDLDLVHPNCSATVTTGCLPYPFDGALLQIMPWPAYRNMTDHDLRAIYEYLSAIPCIDTVVAGQPQLRNTCPAP